MLVNVAHALSLRALHRMTGDAGWDRARDERTEPALLERCWDAKRGLFFDLAGRAERRVEVSTWSSLAPLALAASRARSASASRTSTCCTRAATAPASASRACRWRSRASGPASTPTAPGAAPPGSTRPGCWPAACARSAPDDEADRLARNVADAIERSGFREYYHPRTGSGHGEHRFGFSTLLLDLPAGFPRQPQG